METSASRPFGQGFAPGMGRVQTIALIPPLSFVMIAGLLSLTDLSTVGKGGNLVVVFNTIYLTLTPLTASFYSARSYLRTGSTVILLLGCGLLTLGCASFTSGYVVGGSRGGINAAVTVYNAGFLLCALFHLVGALGSYTGSGERFALRFGQRAHHVLLLYGLSASLIGTLAYLALNDLMPDFFTPERGPTVLRQIVLSLTVTLFATASLILMLIYFKTRICFTYWYALSLLLLAEGLGMLLFLKTVGSPLAWIGRGFQYLGGVYLLIAILQAFRAARTKGIAIEKAIPALVDATKLQRAEAALRENEEHMRLALDAPGLGHWVSDLVDRTLWCSPRLRTMFGLSPDEPVDFTRFSRELFHPDDGPRVDALFRRAVTECTEFIAEFRTIWPSDGSIRWIYARGHAIYEEPGKALKLLGVCLDITGRKEAEEALREARDELEIRVQERTAELVAANMELRRHASKLERLTMEFREFSQVAAHDLQEPLRKVHTFCGLLDRRSEALLPDESKEYLRTIKSEVMRMSALLRSLLAYSRLSEEERPFAPTDLSKVLEATLEIMQAAIATKGGRVEAGALPVIEADAAQIHQLLTHLIDNALKFGSNGAPPLIRIHGQIFGENLQLLVEDNGIGFEAQYAELIFKPFQRLHHRSSDYEGLGIGLTICRKIVERHGGQILGSASPGQGATFVVTLPLRHAERSP